MYRRPGTAGARSQSFKARQELFHKGDDGAQVYVVVHGKLKALITRYVEEVAAALEDRNWPRMQGAPPCPIPTLS